MCRMPNNLHMYAIALHYFSSFFIRISIRYSFNRMFGICCRLPLNFQTHVRNSFFFCVVHSFIISFSKFIIHTCTTCSTLEMGGRVKNMRFSAILIKIFSVSEQQYNFNTRIHRKSQSVFNSVGNNRNFFFLEKERDRVRRIDLEENHECATNIHTRTHARGFTTFD